MCNFFSFVTEPEAHGGKRFYFDWKYRKKYPHVDTDSHSHICAHYGLEEDKCNKYEFNPLTKEFEADSINSAIDDCVQVEEWANKLDFGKIVEPLVIKPILNPFKLPPPELTPEDIEDLKKWASVRASIGDSVRVLVMASVWASIGDSVRVLVMASVWASIGDSVRASIEDSVRASIGDSVRVLVMASVWASIGDSVYGYISSFFRIPYKYDYSAITRLWERGIVASFDGQTWRLHSGKDAHVIYTMESEK